MNTLFYILLFLAHVYHIANWSFSHQILGIAVCVELRSFLSSHYLQFWGGGSLISANLKMVQTQHMQAQTNFCPCVTLPLNFIAGWHDPKKKAYWGSLIIRKGKWTLNIVSECCFWKTDIVVFKMSIYLPGILNFPNPVPDQPNIICCNLCIIGSGPGGEGDEPRVSPTHHPPVTPPGASSSDDNDKPINRSSSSPGVITPSDPRESPLPFVNRKLSELDFPDAQSMNSFTSTLFSGGVQSERDAVAQRGR